MLENRPFKLRKPSYECLCPLCATPRQMRFRQNLSKTQYTKMIFTTAFLTWALVPLMHEKAVFIFFIVWPSFEIINKILYRKELPCPYCGFDATWYRRDVKVARKIVKNFWDKKNTPQEVTQ